MSSVLNLRACINWAVLACMLYSGIPSVPFNCSRYGLVSGLNYFSLVVHLVPAWDGIDRNELLRAAARRPRNFSAVCSVPGWRELS